MKAIGEKQSFIPKFLLFINQIINLSSLRSFEKGKFSKNYSVSQRLSYYLRVTS